MAPDKIADFKKHKARRAHKPKAEPVRDTQAEPPRSIAAIAAHCEGLAAAYRKLETDLGDIEAVPLVTFKRLLGNMDLMAKNMIDLCDHLVGMQNERDEFKKNVSDILDVLDAHWHKRPFAPLLREIEDAIRYEH